MRLPRNAQVWLPGVIRDAVVGSRAPATDLWVAITDHYEPYWGQATPEVAASRVGRWVREWPEVASRHSDGTGHRPVYSFFYPAEEYDPKLLDQLAGFTEDGIGDVEVHLHHDGEGEAHFVDMMSGFVESLRSRHGLLRLIDGKPAWCFIHGNWALDNSHPSGRFCGLNNELTLLASLGCQADFTLPAAPSPCQTRRVNSIYRATDDPMAPKSHDDGQVVAFGGKPGSGLLMVQGPLTIRRHQRWPWLPGVECGELTPVDPPTPHRIARWLAVAPQIGSHQFLKLHTHGAKENNAEALLGGGLDRLFTLLRDGCATRGITLHFVSAWEMVTTITQLEQGTTPDRAVMP